MHEVCVTQDSSRMVTARGRKRHKSKSMGVVRNLEERNAREKSLISVKGVTIELPFLE